MSKNTRGSFTVTLHNLLERHDIENFVPLLYISQKESFWLFHCRFLMYEYMTNGSLKDHLHCKPVPCISSTNCLWFKFVMMHICSSFLMTIFAAAPSRTPLSWSNRIQIAIDVANALVSFLYYGEIVPCFLSRRSFFLK